jgi:serine/threonine protein kinase
MNEDSIFLEALQKPTPAERRVFVEQACGDDAELRRGVEQLLQAHARAGDFLQIQPEIATLDQPMTERPGTVIGPYKLLEQIGEGGFGVVFMAEQHEPIRRKVALKVLKPGMDSKQVIARFEAERQALALMDHPNIATVLDAGQTASGRPYFVMDLVRGLPITAFCDQNQYTPRQRLELFVSVCQAVQHAHHKGIIHRDLKPSNILVALYDDRPVVKVIDFGVAKATRPPLTAQTLHTSIGAVVGTLEYMSPEQAGLNQLDVDARSDIYALGVLLYELLTGTTPLERKRFQETPLLELLRIIREDDTVRPSDRLSTVDELASISAQRHTEPAKLTRLMRGEVDWIVMKALEKDRNRRYETASAFAADVGHYLSDELVLACPPSRWYQVRKFVRRNKEPVLAAAIFLLLLLAGIVGTTIGLVQAHWAWDEEATQRTAAEFERDEKTKAVVKLRRERDEKTKAVQELRRNVTALRVALAHRDLLAGDLDKARQGLDACPADLRDCNWQWVYRLCHMELLTIPGGGPIIRGLKFSPDGRRLAVRSGDGVLRIWDTATGQEAFSLPKEWTAADWAFLAGGDRLVSFAFPDLLKGGGSSWHLEMRVWDSATAKMTPAQRWPTPVSGPIALHPDGRHVICNEGGTLKKRDILTGREVVALGQADPGVMVFSPNGQYLAHFGLVVALPQRQVTVFDTVTGQRQWAAKFEGFFSFQFVALGPDGRRLVVTKSDPKTNTTTYQLWDLESNRALRTLPHGTGTFGPDGRLAVLQPRKVVTLDAATGQEEFFYADFQSQVAALAFSPDGRCLAAGMVDGTIILLDVRPLAAAANGKPP